MAGNSNEMMEAIQQEEHYLHQNPQPRRPPRFRCAKRPLMTEEERAEASARARAWLVRLRRTLEEIKAEQAARWRRTELRGAAPDYVYSGGSRRAVESPRQHEKRFL